MSELRKAKVWFFEPAFEENSGTWYHARSSEECPGKDYILCEVTELPKPLTETERLQKELDEAWRRIHALEDHLRANGMRGPILAGYSL